MSKYSIVSVEPSTYADARKGVINGVLVTVHLDDYNEDHELRMPSMNTADVKKAVEDIVKQRDALANLGKSST